MLDARTHRLDTHGVDESADESYRSLHAIADGLLVLTLWHMHKARHARFSPLRQRREGCPELELAEIPACIR